ncbi:Oxidoreductase, molybdopterin-binding domain-containing protein [Apiosordaria backusii]|uniref:Oxidoreductase, molybdopterin-binding domain-containing protein n=1 Tax=Apiosordaria backusii TaxID=314023 RepID=A0AA40DRC5_9PEZI|nr:Oxidoreductase, molybdopterin-binding domain-containing protein [Apiosordaria backusii]
MDQLKDDFHDSKINIPVAMACTGNRRKELNLQRKTKGANNGAASVGFLRLKDSTSTLLAQTPPQKALTYETSIPLEYAMNPSNDVILAMYMNDLPLPPDHGYPVRLIIPGYIGGHCVKWLRRIWITQ